MRRSKIRRFTESAILRAYDPRLLGLLLRRYADPLAKAGLVLPPDGPLDDKSLCTLAQIAARGTDPELHDLLEALHFIAFMGTQSGRDRIREEAAHRSVDITHYDQYAPRNFALAIWLDNPALIQYASARTAMLAQRSFAHFQPFPGSDLTYRPPDCQSVAELEKDLTLWFRVASLGKGTQVFHYVEPTEHWFLIRRGGYAEWQGCQNDKGEPYSIFYRPDEYDVIVFEPGTSTLRIHTQHRDKKLTQQYRNKFGEFLFGTAAAFGESAIFTLDPLLHGGPENFGRTPVEGIEWVRLTGLSYTTLRAARLEITGGTLSVYDLNPGKPLLPTDVVGVIHANLLVKFHGTVRPRCVQVHQGNRLNYCCDADSSALGRWLRAHGFQKVGSPSTDERAA